MDASGEWTESTHTVASSKMVWHIHRKSPEYWNVMGGDWMFQFLKKLFHKEPDIIKVVVSEHTENPESGNYWVRDSDGCYMVPKSTEDWIAIFIIAKNRRDSVMMRHALDKARERCEHSNSDCLSKVFCPECSYGGFDIVKTPEKDIEPLKITFYN